MATLFSRNRKPKATIFHYVRTAISSMPRKYGRVIVAMNRDAAEQAREDAALLYLMESTKDSPRTVGYDELMSIIQQNIDGLSNKQKVC